MDCCKPNSTETVSHWDGSLVVTLTFPGGRTERHHYHTLQSRELLERMVNVAMAGAIWPWDPKNGVSND